jgi:hypothetical protein
MVRFRPASLYPLDGMYQLADSRPTSAPHPRLDWVITGGESGKDARPSHPDWFRSLRDQCAGAGVAFHHKQNGEWQDGSDFEHPQREHRIIYNDGRNGPYTEQYARSQDLEGLHNGFNPTVVARVGTKRSGHLLDGVEHRAVPA